jgi:hypothetical protein
VPATGWAAGCVARLRWASAQQAQEGGRVLGRDSATAPDRRSSSAEEYSSSRGPRKTKSEGVVYGVSAGVVARKK